MASDTNILISFYYFHTFVCFFFLFFFFIQLLSHFLAYTTILFKVIYHYYYYYFLGRGPIHIYKLDISNQSLKYITCKRQNIHDNIEVDQRLSNANLQVNSTNGEILAPPINQDLWWPKPSGTSSREEKFGLPIYLLVGFLALLLDMASNAVLIVQSNSFFSQA